MTQHHPTALASNRREYGQRGLNKQEMADSPWVQFDQWFQEAVSSEVLDPTAMVLSTVDSQGRPDARVVLLKGIENNAFVFYTNYNSSKALQLNTTPYAALTFYWPTMVRQVRIRGAVQRVSDAESDAYFASRPKASQYSAIASPQSQIITDRAYLEAQVEHVMQEQIQCNHEVERPVNWGGFAVFVDEMEFWQGRDNRLHDRILYAKDDKSWKKERLAP
ncbi:MAG: pyridoxamine 5'-phosphate oxidase [Legionellaceae bacterium]|jgi:pyridoxamine 5'-phosphate oxidase|nr:pyridoxamine 5'-phosphate oxidase [Legionellaceae bacterium]